MASPLLDVSNTTIFDPVLVPQNVGTPPAAPTNLVASAISSSQINLTWSDNDTTEDGFKIERCTGAGCSNFAQIATVGANITSYANTSLTASTSYTYRVRAYNATGDSDYSNTANATTQAAPAVPNAPTNLVATAVSKSQINLSWTDNATNETGFYIERYRLSERHHLSLPRPSLQCQWCFCLLEHCLSNNTETVSRSSRRQVEQS